MAREVNRGEIWLYQLSHPDRRRPVVVLTRQEVIPLLSTVMVAPVTSTIRGAPSEVRVGVEEGLKQESAVNLDHVQTVEKARLRQFVGTLPPHRMKQICRALAIATGVRGVSERPSRQRPGVLLRLDRRFTPTRDHPRVATVSVNEALMRIAVLSYAS